LHVPARVRYASIINNMLEFAKNIQFPELGALRGRAAGVLLEPLPGSGERYCVAVVGAVRRGAVGARETVNPRIARYMLGGDLAGSLYSFAQVVVRDFSHLAKAADVKKWLPPFNGMYLTSWRDFQVRDLDDLLLQASMTFATLAHGEPVDEIDEEFTTTSTPRATDESAFRENVRRIVKARTPDLDVYFDQEISASGSERATFKMDYLSPHLAACFTAINPITPHKHLLSRAQTCLWRVARARDSGHLFKPKKGNLIAWLPEPGLPIFTHKHYELIREIQAELTYEAKKDDIEIVSMYRDINAAEHLITSEAWA